jgi:serine/threonine protein kinase
MGDQDQLLSRRKSSGSVLAKGAVLSARYEILDYVGEGGMGVVYKAHDRALDEIVAIKLLLPHLLDSPLMRQRFLSEIKLARKVTHRNVCRIHDYGEDGPLGYVSMQFIEGAELKALIAQPCGVSIDEAYDIAIQLADGLQAIHDEGIVHRDLKSANIMVDARGHPRLMDFGIAKLWDVEGGAGLTLEGHITGTPDYMSPEQAAGEPLDPRSDLYSLGIVLFELFTGARPFKADNAAGLMYKQVYEEPPLDAPVAAAIPAPVKPILRKALAKRRDDRFASALELNHALLEARGGVPTLISDTTETIVTKVLQLRGALDKTVPVAMPSPQAPAPSRPQGERPRRISRRGLWQLLTAAGVAVIAAVSMYPYFWQGRTPAGPAVPSPPAASTTTAPSPPPAATVERGPTPQPSAPQPPPGLPARAPGRDAATRGEPGPPQAAEAGAMAACERGDAEVCRRACEAGVPAACTQLGVLYNRGAGVPRDLGNAVLYYQRGCTGGDLAGCNNLGTMYQFGALGLRGDTSKAAGLYERACNGGHLEACVNLGLLYQSEPGSTAEQRMRGRELLQKACAAGIARACRAVQ